MTIRTFFLRIGLEAKWGTVDFRDRCEASPFSQIIRCKDSSKHTFLFTISQFLFHY